MSLRFVPSAVGALLTFLDRGLARSLEPVRLARASHALLAAGCEPSMPIFQRTAAALLNAQQPDGGWSDPLETAWSYAVLTRIRGFDTTSAQSASNWLRLVRQQHGGWGMHPRDRSRIPVTCFIAGLVPSVFTQEDLFWVVQEWTNDLAGPVQLTYKAGFFLLMAAARSPMQPTDLVAQTLEHLTSEQNDDGGFGPWRNHPVGSDPWSTGVVLWGLSGWSHQVAPTVEEKALGWLERNQLPTGFWIYHYLDEGTSLALIGATAAARAKRTAQS